MGKELAQDIGRHRHHMGTELGGDDDMLRMAHRGHQNLGLEGRVVAVDRHNIGNQGHAVLTGFRQALTEGYTHLVQVDADGQHDLAALPDMLALAAQQPDAVVAGYAVYDTSAPLGRVVGRWIINRVVGVLRSGMNRSAVDPTLTQYLGSIVGVILNIVLVIGILGYFGIQTTSFAALLAGAGLAIGAAWSGMLGNFAAGAFMLVLRPFKVGDAVSVGGVTGTVQELGLFGTTIVTGESFLSRITA